MPSPFPGMDPYLEHPALWPGFHNRLIAALDEDLSPRLLPRYFIALEERVYIAEPPDYTFVGLSDAVVRPANAEAVRSAGSQPTVARQSSSMRVITAELPMPDHVRETYLEVREAASGEVVTLIELLSPANKRSGDGRRQYLAKRLQTLGTLTHLVEIDLLRGGEPLPMRLPGQLQNDPPPGDYRILIAQGGRRPWADVYAFTVRDPVPPFPLPLRSGDDEVLVDLQALIQLVYDRAGYGIRLDYRGEPVPPLGGEDSAWARGLVGR